MTEICSVSTQQYDRTALRREYTAIVEMHPSIPHVHTGTSADRVDLAFAASEHALTLLCAIYYSCCSVAWRQPL